jgi:hypothetical protein
VTLGKRQNGNPNHVPLRKMGLSYSGSNFLWEKGIKLPRGQFPLRKKDYGTIFFVEKSIMEQLLLGIKILWGEGLL